LAVLNGLGVEGAADDFIADTGEVFDTAAADENHGVLLEVVSDSGDVRGDFDAAG